MPPNSCWPPFSKRCELPLGTRWWAYISFIGLGVGMKGGTSLHFRLRVECSGVKEFADRNSSGDLFSEDICPIDGCGMSVSGIEGSMNGKSTGDLFCGDI